MDKELSPIKQAKHLIFINEMIKDKPKILFKYRNSTTDYNLRTLFERELFLSSARNFNDPFDCSIPFVVNSESIEPDKIFDFLFQTQSKLNPGKTTQEIHELCFQIQKNNHFSDPNFHKDLSEWHKEEVYQCFGILSLTSNEKNFLMWSHYAESHTGYCIGFRTEDLVHIEDGYLDKVLYQSEIPEIDIAIYKSKDINLFLEKILCVKSTSWSYEDEFRFIVNYCSNKTVKYKAEIVDQVIFGCKMNFEMKKNIIEFLSKEFPKCKIYEMKLSKTQFKLEKIQIL